MTEFLIVANSKCPNPFRFTKREEFHFICEQKKWNWDRTDCRCWAHVDILRSYYIYSTNANKINSLAFVTYLNVVLLNLEPERSIQIYLCTMYTLQFEFETMLIFAEFPIMFHVWYFNEFKFTQNYLDAWHPIKNQIFNALGNRFQCNSIIRTRRLN